MSRGDEVRGELFSADASASADMVLYTSEGDVRTLEAGERLCVTALWLASTPGGAVSVYAGTDEAGKRLLKGHVPAADVVSIHANTPINLPRGVVPTVVAPAGNVGVFLSGFIVRS